MCAGRSSGNGCHARLRCDNRRTRRRNSREKQSNSTCARLANRIDRTALHATLIFFVSAMAVYMAYKALS
jgi:hypothetical protein